MKLNDIARLRLLNQQISRSDFKTPKEVVEWMGAMQAQDYNMSRWAIGLRLPGSTAESVDEAADKGEIIRTHALRPTWHWVTSDDIYWMLELTAPQNRSSMKSRDRALGLDEEIYSKSNNIIGNAVNSGRHLTREELVAELVKGNVPVDQNRASHLLFRAEIEEIVCSGMVKAGKPTYALLSGRVSKVRRLKKDQAIATLAEKYFFSHGPATIQDFSWWSGLSVSLSKQGLESVKSALISETINSQEYWFNPSRSPDRSAKDLTIFLPGYDEFIISYRDRTASVPTAINKIAISSNGIFWPVIIRGGEVAGIWKRVTKKDEIILETEIFESSGLSLKKLIKSAEAYGRFMNRKIRLI